MAATYSHLLFTNFFNSAAVTAYLAQSRLWPQLWALYLESIRDGLRRGSVVSRTFGARGRPRHRAVKKEWTSTLELKTRFFRSIWEHI